MRANVQEIWYKLIMRRVRITYPGAYHHVMNRGYDGNAISAGTVTKSHFIDYLEDAVTEMKMRIFAYCIMDNHYHMVLENTTGKMSDFMKLLNGNFGMYYNHELSKIVDSQYVNELFDSKDALFGTCDSMGRKELCIIKSEYGRSRFEL